MQIENIHPGDHVVIVGLASERYAGERSEHYGGPAKVVALCPPYIAIQPVGHPGVKTIDTRIWELTKASKRYVQVFADAFREDTNRPVGVLVSAPMDRLAAMCPVCNRGHFSKVTPDNQEPHWRCSECRSVKVE